MVKMVYNIICPTCGKEFFTKRETRKYCSRPCNTRSLIRRQQNSELLKGKPGYFKGKKFTLEHRQNLSEAKKGKPSGMKGKKHKQESKDKMAEAKKGKKLPQETRDKMSEARKGDKNPNYGNKYSEEFRLKLSELQKGDKHPNWKGGKIKINCKLCGKENYFSFSGIKVNGNFCSNSCSNIYNITHQKKKGTDIELLMKEELIKRNISFVPQHPLLNMTIVDFFIQPNIVIYCDGDYWHSFDKAKERDNKQTSILTLNNYKVYRFTGKEIYKSVENCINKIFNEECYVA